MGIKRLPNIVCIGSKSSAFLVFKGFPELKGKITAIVPVTDSGSSTGIIRENFLIPAPGDLRAIISLFSSLKGKEVILKKLFEYRFAPEKSKDLKGMALGNLILVALSDLCGSFEKGINSACKLLKVSGEILPVTLTNTELCAELTDGTIVYGEREVRRMNKPAIKNVFLRDIEVSTTQACRRAIYMADLICIGPGCLYTSLIPCLITQGITKALSISKGKIIYICNHTTTPGQTDGFTILRHIEEIQKYLKPATLDYCLITNQCPSPEMVRTYQKEKIFFILPNKEEILKIEKMGIKLILDNFIERGWQSKRMLHKLDTIRHDPRKVRKALLKVYKENFNR